MSRSSVYVFVDLDDSLLQTREKCRQGPLTEAAHDRTGAPLSFHTPQQRALLELFHGALLIPVTGRNLTALRRVVSPSFASYRITSHGALVLGPDERPLPGWDGRLREQVPYWTARLSDAAGLAEELILSEQLGLRVRIIEDLGIPVYVSVKGPSPELARLGELLVPSWRDGILHRNDQNLALLPSFADKAAAVRFLMDEIVHEANGEEPLFIGVGDSLTDLPFLRHCHFAVVPQHSQIQCCTWP